MAAATPATGGSGTYTGPVPGSGSYGLYKAQADAAYAAAEAKIAAQRGQFLQNSGLVGEYDPSGAYTGFHINASDPTGSYQQMQMANALTGQQNDAAVAGMGFQGGGLTKAMHEKSQQGLQDNASNWAQNVVQQIGAFGQADQSATQQYGDQLYTNLLNDVQTAIQNGTYNPANYNGISIPGYGDITGLPTLNGVQPVGGTTSWQPGQGIVVSGKKTGTTNTRTIYGFGKKGNPFYSRGAAAAAGKLIKGM